MSREPASGNQPNKRQVLKFISVAFLFVPILFIGMALFVLPGMNVETIPEAVEGKAQLELALAAVAAFLLIASVPLPGVLLKSPAARKAKDHEAEQKLFSAYIVSLAVRESAAVIGLVLTILTGDASWVVAFGAMVFFFGLWQWPTEGYFEKHLKKRLM